MSIRDSLRSEIARATLDAARIGRLATSDLAHVSAAAMAAAARKPTSGLKSTQATARAATAYVQSWATEDGRLFLRHPRTGDVIAQVGPRTTRFAHKLVLKGLVVMRGVVAHGCAILDVFLLNQPGIGGERERIALELLYTAIGPNHRPVQNLIPIFRSRLAQQKGIQLRLPLTQAIFPEERHIGVQEASSGDFEAAGAIATLSSEETEVVRTLAVRLRQ